MMFKTKYVIIDDKLPRIFSEAELHKNMLRHGEKCTSAGFVNFTIKSGDLDREVIEVDCYGESVSLQIGANPSHDERIIGMFILNNHI